MSQEEIDLLIDELGEEADVVKSRKENSSIVTGNINRRQNKSSTNFYKKINFREPNKLQYDNLGALKQIHEQFAKSLNNYLTILLRCNVQANVDFEMIEQLTYQQYCNLASKNRLWGVYSTASNQEDGRCFLQFENAFCDLFIDRSFGGSAEFIPLDEHEDYKMSDINKEMSKKLFIDILEVYSRAWDNSNVTHFDMVLKSIEENVQNLNLGVISSEMMLIIPIELLLFQKREEDDETITYNTSLNIGIPYNVIEPVLDELNISNILSAHKSDVENDDVKKNIQQMTNKIDAYVGETTIKFYDLLKLSKDDIIFVNKKKTDPYSVYVAGVKKYDAIPYKLNNKICLKIVKKGDETYE